MTFGLHLDYQAFILIYYSKLPKGQNKIKQEENDNSKILDMVFFNHNQALQWALEMLIETTQYSRYISDTITCNMPSLT